MMSWVVVLDGRGWELLMTTHASGCSDPAWKLVRPPSW